VNIRVPRLSAEESKLLTKVTTLGSGTALPVVMSPGELVRLIGVIYFDNGMGERLEEVFSGLWAQINPGIGYYSIEDDWFALPVEMDALGHVYLMRHASSEIEDFVTYLRCLSELHKRRKKYSMILAAQPLPTMVQVSPRSLMEYGNINPEALASWLTWRKFFYDLDNRSAQETGYLFEPILAAAIGGEPKGARSKVVKRTGDPTKGRQVDCWKVPPSGRPLAYEFKLRVTIAASGQGRFKEELQFAEDCQNSGAVPILVVLDPTPNPRLADLRQEFEARGGEAYLGDEAWGHLESVAGTVMSRFIENYVRRPVTDISRFETGGDGDSPRGLQLLDLKAHSSNNELLITLGIHTRRIARREDASLADETEQGEPRNGENP